MTTTAHHHLLLYRLRRAAATALFEQRLCELNGRSLATTTRVAQRRAAQSPVSEEYLQLLFGRPGRPPVATQLRAEVFAAQLRAYSGASSTKSGGVDSAASFIKDELWRPGRRHTAEEILGSWATRTALIQPYLPRNSRRYLHPYEYELTHLDESGRARMVDVSSKTSRTARQPRAQS